MPEQFMPEQFRMITKDLDAGLHALWEVAEQWADTKSDHDNSPEDQRILDALQTLRNLYSPRPAHGHRSP